MTILLGGHSKKAFMGQKTSVWLGGKANKEIPKGATRGSHQAWLDVDKGWPSCSLHGVLSGKCHCRPQQSQTHEVESFFHLMNNRSSCLLESKDLKKRVNRSVRGREHGWRSVCALCLGSHSSVLILPPRKGTLVLSPALFCPPGSPG